MLEAIATADALTDASTHDPGAFAISNARPHHYGLANHHHECTIWSAVPFSDISSFNEFSNAAPNRQLRARLVCELSQRLPAMPVWPLVECV